MSYISLATANRFFSDEDMDWNVLTDANKEKALTDASHILDRCEFKTDTDSTTFPRFNAGGSPSNPATGKLAWVVAYFANWVATVCYEVKGKSKQGSDVQDLGLKVIGKFYRENYEETSKVGSLEKTQIYKQDAVPPVIVLDLSMVPRDLQMMVASFCKNIHPKFKKFLSSGARPISYV